VDLSAVRCCDAVRRESEESKLYSILKEYTMDDLLYVPTETDFESHYESDKDCIRHQNRTESPFEMGCAAQSLKMRLTKYGQIFVDD